jgi:cytochrome P450
VKQVPKIKIPFLTYQRMAKEDVIGLRTKIFSDYGDIAAGKIAGNINYYLAHPDYAKHILKDNPNNYFNKHALTCQLFHPLIGKGLFIINDRMQWHRDRMTANVSFDPKVYFEDYAETVTSLCSRMLTRWKTVYSDGHAIDLNHELGALIISFIQQTVFTHIEIDTQALADILLKLSDLIKIKLHTLPWLWGFSSANRAYQQYLVKVKTLSADIIQSRLQGTEKWDDILGYYIDEYRHLPVAEQLKKLSDQVMAFFAVGYFTTYSLISWILVEMALNPQIEQCIAAEVRQVLGDRPPCYSDVSSLNYLSLVIKETLRLHPSAFSLMRQTSKNDCLDDYFIQGNAGIILSIYHIHRHRDFWVNPEKFDPERFRHNPSGQENPFAYIPFGSGERRCPGASFSTLEATLAIASLIQRCNLTLPENTIIKSRMTTLLTISPDVNHMLLHFKKYS